MKKLLYTLLAVSIIFSACEEEEVAPSNTNNNNNNNNPSSIIGYGWGNDDLYKTTDGGVTWNFIGDLVSTGNFASGNMNKISFVSEEVGIFYGLNSVNSGNGPTARALSCKTTVSGGLGFSNDVYTSNCINPPNNYGVLDYENGALFLETAGNMLWYSLYDAVLRKFEIPNNGSLSIPYPDSVGMINTAIDFTEISFLDNNIGFAISRDGSVSKTTDGGSSWNSIGSLPVGVFNLTFPSANVGYATVNSWIYKTTDGGNTWTQLTQIDINLIEFVTENIGYGFFSNMLYQTTDGGDNWSMIYDNSIGLSSISFVN